MGAQASAARQTVHFELQRVSEIQALRERQDSLRKTYSPEDRALAAWAAGEKTPQEKDVPYPDERIQKSKSEHKVRSKAEIMIDQDRR